MAEVHPNLVFTPSVLQADAEGPFVVGPISRIVANYFPKLEGWRGFVCGDPSLVQSLKRQLFLSGIAMRDIYADAFLPSAA